MLGRKPVFRLHCLKFIEETTRQIIAAQAESFQEMQPLRYALASVLRSLAPEFVDSKSEKFDLRTRKRLFDILLSWSDDTGGTWSQDGISDYRREVERYKSTQHARSKDSIDKLTFDKEMSEQIEAIQWASMNAMASLLYGPCFDDNARKMSGRVISWINSLFIESVPRAPFGHSPADPRTPSYSKFTGDGGRGATGRERHRGGHLRVSLAKMALKNLLLTNLDLFPACIDQVYVVFHLVPHRFMYMYSFHVSLICHIPKMQLEKQFHGPMKCDDLTGELFETKSITLFPLLFHVLSGFTFCTNTLLLGHLERMRKGGKTRDNAREIGLFTLSSLCKF